MKTILITFFVTLFSIVLFNYFIDVEGKFVTRDFYQNIQFPSDQNSSLVVPPNHNQRLLRINWIRGVSGRTFEYVIIASSRGLMIGEDIIGSESVLNLSMSTASIDEYVELLNLLREHKIIYNNLILVLDYWQFNENVLGDDLSSFEVQKRMSLREIKRHLVHLMSIDTLTMNFNYLWSSLEVRTLFFKLLPVSGLPPSVYAYKNGGDMIYPEGKLKSFKASEGLKEYIQDLHLNEATHYIYNDYSLSYRKLDSINEILIRAKVANIKTFIAIPPFSRFQVELIENDKRYSSIIKDFRSSVNKLFPYRMCNYLADEKFNCDDLQMHDSVHPTKECLKKFFIQCLVR